MTTSFEIQTGQPRTEAAHDPEDESLCDAIQGAFPLRTEHMFMVWNHVYIPLGYKYDVSLIVDDALDLVDAMLSEATGLRTIHWPSNTFASSWTVEWRGALVTIQATWSCVLGGTESLLNASGPVVLPVDEFVAEWKRPFELVARALREAGYSEHQIPRLAVLESVASRVRKHGRLYVLQQDQLPRSSVHEGRR